MLEIHERLGMHCHAEVAHSVVLSHEQRDRGRLKVTTPEGEEVRIFLERGQPLRVGEFLKTDCGQVLQVAGAVEAVAHASCDDWHVFARACYHLGNRHSKIQVGDRWLRIKPDHVLEELLHLLGLVVTHEQAIFNAESGAYAQGHSHSHD
jgi:urease accessory protein